METLTGGDFGGLLIDGNAQGFIDGIAVLVEMGGPRPLARRVSAATGGKADRSL